MNQTPTPSLVVAVVVVVAGCCNLGVAYRFLAIATLAMASRWVDRIGFRRERRRRHAAIVVAARIAFSNLHNTTPSEYYKHCQHNVYIEGWMDHIYDDHLYRWWLKNNIYTTTKMAD